MVGYALSFIAGLLLGILGTYIYIFTRPKMDFHNKYVRGFVDRKDEKDF